MGRVVRSPSCGASETTKEIKGLLTSYVVEFDDSSRRLTTVGKDDDALAAVSCCVRPQHRYAAENPASAEVDRIGEFGSGKGIMMTDQVPVARRPRV